MTWIAFLAAATLLAITPGPGIAYVVARTAAGGRGEGLASCLGTGIGGMVHVFASALGLSVLLAQSAIAFTVLKYAGAAYLAWLGIRMLLRRDAGQAFPTVAASGPRRALLEGVAVEALNVKTALFFLAFLPQFVDPAHPPLLQYVVMGTVCVVLNTLADVVAVLAAGRLLASPGLRAARARALTKVSGVTMLGLAAWLALTRRSAA